MRDNVLGVVHPIFFDDVADNIDSIEKAANYVQAEFKILDGLLENSEYLTGGNISAADIILFPLVQALQRAMVLKSADLLDLEFKYLNSCYPKIANWVALIESIPGYDKTYPPNWKD